MTDENKTPKIEYNYAVDQTTSANAQFPVEIGGDTVNILLTARHNASVEIIVADTEKLIAAYAQLREAHPRNFPTNSQPNPFDEPKRVPLDDNGNEAPQVKFATAGRLSYEVHDGKANFKVMDAVFAAGERGTKYGITAYPEVLAAAKLDVSNPAQLPNISGWTVKYILNDKGYPYKVVGILPPK